MKKYIYLLFVVLLSITFCIGVFVGKRSSNAVVTNSSSPSPTVNTLVWKEYKTDAGVSFMFPYSVSNVSPYLKDEANFCKIDLGYHSYITIKPYDGSPLQGFFNKQYPEIPKEELSFHPIIVDGEQGVEVWRNDMGSINFGVFAVIPKGNHVLIIASPLAYPDPLRPIILAGEVDRWRTILSRIHFTASNLKQCK